MSVPEHSTESHGVSSNEQQVIAFISGIPEEINDSWLEKILSACGEIASWKRVQAADGSPQAFGFCEFKSIYDAARTMRVLSSDRLKNLPSTSPQLLKIQLDNKQKHYQERGIDSKQNDSDILQSLERIFDEIEKSKSTASNDSGDKSAPKESADDEDKDFSLDLEVAWEKEQAQKARHKRYIAAAEERERHIAIELKERESRLERNAMRELDDIEEKQRRQEAMSTLLSKWNDSQEEQLGEHEYYRDRQRWWRRRKAERAREMEVDEADRYRQEREESANAETATANDQRDMIEALIKEIPSDPKLLFEWPVKWECIDTDLVKTKVEPAVRKRLVEYLGGEGDDGSVDELTEYVTTHIEHHKPPQGLVEELEMVLVDEALVFVARIWRFVVYESEARVCLAAACLGIGFYILYILVHVPAMLEVLQGSEPQLESASLIDMDDDGVLFAVDLHFPNWGRRAATVPFANTTIYYHEDAVGWLYAKNLEVTPHHKRLSLYDVFHVTNAEAMGSLLAEAAARRRVTVSAQTGISLGGFGRYLPVVSVHRELELVLPPLPAANITFQDVVGPVDDTVDGGVTMHAKLLLNAPIPVSANISPVRIDARYQNITIASVDIGPTTMFAGGVSSIPVTTNIKRISSSAHEEALANLAMKISSGEGAELLLSGSDPSCCEQAPLWLRQMLHMVEIPIATDIAQLPHYALPPYENFVKKVSVDKLYAYWSAEDSYKPWAGISAQVLIEIPNTSGANATFEIESLVPHLQLVDEDNQPFATIDIVAIPIQLKQVAPFKFVVSCGFDRLGLSVVSGKEEQFTYAMKRALSDRNLALGINGTLDIVLATSIGLIHINKLPVDANIDWTFDADIRMPHSIFYNAIDAAPNAEAESSSAKVSVNRIHVAETTRELLVFELGLDIVNPFTYGAFITDLALNVNYDGLHIATVGVEELSLSKGKNTQTVYVHFNNYPEDLRQKRLFLEASVGRNITIEVAGFPNCTRIPPLEASLREFTKELTVDTSKLRKPGTSSGKLAGSFPQVLQEVVFHIFSMAAEATVVNPVSGAGIWLQKIEAIGYYHEDVPLGTLEYDFTAKQPSGLRLPYNQAVTTPRLPITANETSIGWDLLRKAIGGTLNVDVFTNIQMQIGNAPLNFTVLGKNAPVKVRL
ncbi:hypothetical protein LPJ55_004183 [Coemansia sp. RSA 990]|nr:hypothetical protein LPJ55_004183 [Coemansia sp. RSA 990]